MLFVKVAFNGGRDDGQGYLIIKKSTLLNFLINMFISYLFLLYISPLNIFTISFLKYLQQK